VPAAGGKTAVDDEPPDEVVEVDVGSVEAAGFFEAVVLAEGDGLTVADADGVRLGPVVEACGAFEEHEAATTSIATARTTRLMSADGTGRVAPEQSAGLRCARAPGSIAAR
jgi:hypothetical protein